ncbi:MAG: DUF4290 domain-containing protein [Bacteroidaceae bacterium]|nr:DUF4290 domain-containing protein [Bacteroidaceae bacterium]
MDYNTDREKLTLSEYGRNIQNMVNHALTIENRADRQRCAETIVSIMRHMFPSVSQRPDATQVLWDHLARMAHYKLDIDYPVKIAEEAETMAKPEPLAYPMTHIRYRHYGHLVEDLIGKISDMEEGDRKERLIELTANQMRKDLFYWNKDGLKEERIASDIDRYTKGKVHMELGKYRFAATVPNNNFPKAVSTKKTRGKK